MEKDNNTIRLSGIEILKLWAMQLIIICHVVQTLYLKNDYVTDNGYLLDFSNASMNAQLIILQIFNSFGTWGNIIFFVCSAWFLLDSNTYKKKKWFHMLIEIWIISVFFLITIMIIRSGQISTNLILKSIFPTTFSNNSYLTCYLLFYPIHPFLNKIINNLSKTSHFRISVVLFFLYLCINFIKAGFFFSNALLLWLTIYFVVGFLKKYMKSFVNNKKANIILFLVTFFLFISIFITLNILGQKIKVINGKMLHFSVYYNPFLFLCTIALFNLSKKIKIKNRTINYLSSLTMLVYILHENILLRTYYRPYMLLFIKEHFGYELIVPEIMIFALILYIVSIIVSVFFRIVFDKPIKKLTDIFFKMVRQTYLRFEKITLSRIK